MRVVDGKRLDINGRRYVAGDIIPTHISHIVVSALVAQGVLENERAESKSKDTRHEPKAATE